MKNPAPAIVRHLLRGGAGLLAVAALVIATAFVALYIGASTFEPLTTTAQTLAAVAAVSLVIGTHLIVAALAIGALNGIVHAFTPTKDPS